MESSMNDVNGSPTLRRRQILNAGGAAIVAMTAASCDMLSTAPADSERAKGQDANKGDEAPPLARQVNAGKLPAVAQRLPNKPLVVQPTQRVGRYGGTLRCALAGAANSAYIWTIAGYENLLNWAPDFTGTSGTDELVPNVAESFEANQDATEFFFHLRPGMKWSDGEPFTADDIVFAVEDVLLNEEIMPTPPDIVSVGKGTASVEKLDDHSVRFTFPDTAGLFLRRLATSDGQSLTHLPRHYLEQFHRKYNPDIDQLVRDEGAADWVQLWGEKSSAFGENPDLPSLWPWQLTTPLGASQHVLLERNPYYWKVDSDGSQLPYIDEVAFDVIDDPELMLLRTLQGDIDLEVGPDTRFTTPANKPVLARDREAGDYRFLDVTQTRTNVMRISFNLTSKDQTKRQIFQDKDFRVALSHAINRDEIIAATMQRQGEPYQVAPIPESPFYDQELADQYLEFDTDLANSLLDRSFPDRDNDGWRLGPDGDPIALTIEYVASFRQEWSEMLNLIKNYWQEVGVDLTLKNMDRSLYSERHPANMMDATVWLAGGGLDPLLNEGGYFPHSPTSQFAVEWGKWYEFEGSEGETPPESPRRQMQLYDQIKTSADPDEQASLMREILSIAADQFYSIGIAREPESYFVASESLYNLPNVMIQSWKYPTPGPTRPEQYSFE